MPLSKIFWSQPPEYEAEILTMPFGVKISYCRKRHEIAVNDSFWLTWTGQIMVYLKLISQYSLGQTPKSNRKQLRTASVLERIRIGYPRNTNRFIDLLGDITLILKQPSAGSISHITGYWIPIGNTDEIPTSRYLTDTRIKRTKRCYIVTGDTHSCSTAFNVFVRIRLTSVTWIL
jgi:hypothetical protein